MFNVFIIRNIFHAKTFKKFLIPVVEEILCLDLQDVSDIDLDIIGRWDCRAGKSQEDDLDEKIVVGWSFCWIFALICYYDPADNAIDLSLSISTKMIIIDG